MAKSKGDSKTYMWVDNSVGKKFLCPMDALKNPERATEEELKECIDVSALGACRLTLHIFPQVRYERPA